MIGGNQSTVKANEAWLVEIRQPLKRMKHDWLKSVNCWKSQHRGTHHSSGPGGISGSISRGEPEGWRNLLGGIFALCTLRPPQCTSIADSCHSEDWTLNLLLSASPVTRYAQWNNSIWIRADDAYIVGEIYIL